MSEYQKNCTTIFNKILEVLENRIKEFNQDKNCVGPIVLSKIKEVEYNHRIGIENTENGQIHNIGVSMKREDYCDANVIAVDLSDYKDRLYPTTIFIIEENGDIVRKEGFDSFPCTQEEAGEYIANQLENVFKK
jgi:hypothetical protein